MNPQNLLEYFISIAPSFNAYWESEDNCNIGEDGSFNFHSVCAEFSLYFHDQSEHKYRVNVEHDWVETIPDEQLVKLFKWLEENIEKEETKDSIKTIAGQLSNALCTCFLENIAQTKAGEYSKKFMSLKSKSFFEQWHTV